MILRVVIIAALLAFAGTARSEDRPALDPLIGARIEPGLRLTDATEAEWQLREMLDGDAALLVLGYHRCENLCGILQRQLADTLSELPAGRAPAVLFASLDPDERPEDARAMRATLAEAAPEADLSRWRFLTGAAPALSQIARPMRMQTYVRPGGEVIVHPAATAVLTPEGRLSEVFYGFDFTAAELDAALARADDGYIGGLRERIVLLCSGIDEAVGRVARNAWAGIQAGALGTVLLLGGALVILWRRERG